jgi:hypothetical protein
MTYAERMLLRALLIKYVPGKQEVTRVYNARRNYPNLTVYRSLEKAGKLRILKAENATTENMLYGMSTITFVLER